MSNTTREWYIPLCDVNNKQKSNFRKYSKTRVTETDRYFVVTFQIEVRDTFKRLLPDVRILTKEEVTKELQKMAEAKREREEERILDRKEKDLRKQCQILKLHNKIDELKRAKEIKLANDRKKRELLKKIALEKEIQRLDKEMEETDMDSTIPDWNLDNWGNEVTGTIITYQILPESFKLQESTTKKGTIRIMMKPFAQGTFRNAFYCKYSSSPRIGKVLRNLRDEYDNCIQDIATLLVSSQFALKFNEKRPTKKIKFASVALMKLDEPWNNAKYISIEEQLPGTFLKYNSNGKFVNEKQKSRTAQAFSHFSHDCSRSELMVTDIQGTKLPDNSFLFTDPAIHSKKKSFGDSDIGEKGMKNFFESHSCNQICIDMGLRRSIYQCKKDDPSGTVMV